MSKYDYNFSPCSIEDLLITVINTNGIAEDFELEFDFYYISCVFNKKTMINNHE